MELAAAGQGDLAAGLAQRHEFRAQEARVREAEVVVRALVAGAADAVRDCVLAAVRGRVAAGQSRQAVQCGGGEHFPLHEVEIRRPPEEGRVFVADGVVADGGERSSFCMVECGVSRMSI